MKIPRFQNSIKNYNNARTKEKSIIFLLKNFVGRLNENLVEEFARPLFVN